MLIQECKVPFILGAWVWFLGTDTSLNIFFFSVPEKNLGAVLKYEHKSLGQVLVRTLSVPMFFFRQVIHGKVPYGHPYLTMEYKPFFLCLH